MAFRHAVRWFAFLFLMLAMQTARGLTVPVNDPNLYFSPCTWYLNSGNFAVANQSGAYFKLSFSGSSTVTLNLYLNGLPRFGGVSSMLVQWSLDGVLSPVHRLVLQDAQLVVGSNLSSGPHNLQFWIINSDPTLDRWTQSVVMPNGISIPAQSLCLTSVTLDDGATTLPYPSLGTRRILFFGDSITAGEMTDAQFSNNATLSYVCPCAAVLNAEFGMVGNSGQGWTGTFNSTDHVPIFPGAFSYYYANTPRFPLPPTASAPDCIVVNMGTNDVLIDLLQGALQPSRRPYYVAQAVAAWLAQMRSLSPSSQIFMVVPFGGFSRWAIQTGVAQYQQTARGDPNVVLIDLDWSAEAGLTGPVPGGTPQSPDGVHPNAATHRLLGFQLAAALQTALGAHSFSGQGNTDLITQNPTTGSVVFWRLTGTTLGGGRALSVSPGADYAVVGSADFNGDGKPDLVLQNRKTGQVSFWFLNGTTQVGSANLSQVPPSGWNVVGVGDFNGDGHPDLVLQDQATNRVRIWYLNGPTVMSTADVNRVPPTEYKVVGVGDFNRDGQLDLVFQSSLTGRIGLWFMNGANFVSGGQVSIDPPAGYRVAAIADLIGDGRCDLILRDALGHPQLWRLDGQTFYQRMNIALPLFPIYPLVGPR